MKKQNRYLSFLLPFRCVVFLLIFVIGAFAVGKQINEISNWWSVVASIVNIVTILILIVVAKMNGINYWELVNYQKEKTTPKQIISMVIVSYLVFAFLSNGNGYINNSLLKALGVPPEKWIQWYNEPKYWPFIIVIVNIWKGLGYNMILYYATICGIDSTLYEAAVVDGATRWQRIRNVTLPGLKSTVIILTLMALGGIFRSDFGLFYQVPQNSGPLINVTQTIDTYVYRGLMQTNNIGMSSAAGLYQSVVGFILVVSANLIVRKIDNESALF